MTVKLVEKLKGKAWVRRLGYPAFFSLAFSGGIYLTFPYDQLRDRIVAEAERATGMEVEIGKVRLAGMSGLTLHGVAISDPASLAAAQAAAEAAAARAAAAAEGGEAEEAGAKEGEEAEEPVIKRVYLDSVTAKADLIALALGKRAFKFDIDAFGGDIHGRVVMGEEEQVFEAKARKIDFAQSPLQAFTGLDLAGNIDTIEIALRSPGADFSKADGTVEIHGADLVLNGGEVQMFELPQVALGALDGRLVFKEGSAEVEEFKLKGQDLEAEIVDTFIRLQPMLKNSSINGKLRFKPSEDWWNRNEMLKSAANFALPAAKDGWRTLTLYGPISSPRFRPQK